MSCGQNPEHHQQGHCDELWPKPKGICPCYAWHALADHIICNHRRASFAKQMTLELVSLWWLIPELIPDKAKEFAVFLQQPYVQELVGDIPSEGDQLNSHPNKNSLKICN